MISMIIGGVGRWLIGGGINALAAAYAKNKDSALESERIQADVARKRMDGLVEAGNAASKVSAVTAGFKEQRVLAFLSAAPFVAHSGAVVLVSTLNLPFTVLELPPRFAEMQPLMLLGPAGVWLVSMLAKVFAAGRVK